MISLCLETLAYLILNELINYWIIIYIVFIFLTKILYSLSVMLWFSEIKF